jgi:prevent-host-death family protein
MYNTYNRYAMMKGVEAMERQLGITEARKQLAQIVDQVKYKGEHCVIIRHGQPAAVVVSMDVYRQWQRRREEFFDAIRRVQEANVDADPDQVMQEVLEAQQAVRRPSAE